MIWQHLQSFFNQQAGAATWSRYIVAFSGGADSTALALLMKRYIGESGNGQSLLLAHCNHCLRGAESDADEDFCRRFAAENGVEIVCQRLNVTESRLARESMEMAARRLRYGFLDRLAVENPDSALVFAHHADDQAETLCMNIMRGCGVLGLAGIPPIRRGVASILRPLLGISRDDILAYLRECRQTWREDASNSDPRYLRNLVRHALLPKLSASHPNIRDQLTALNTAAQRLWAWLQPQVESALESMTDEARASHVLLNREALLAQPTAIRDEALRLAVYRLAEQNSPGCGHMPSRRQLQRILELLGRSKTGGECPIYGRLRAVLEPGALCLYACSSRERGICLKIETERAFPIMRDGIAVEWKATSLPGAKAQFAANPAEAHVDRDKIKFPLLLRQWNHGDRFRALGAPGSGLVSDFFTNRKIPKRLRRDALVLEDADGGIIWVWPHEIADKVRISSQTKECVQLKIERI